MEVCRCQATQASYGWKLPWLRRVASTLGPDTLSRYTSHFYRNTFAQVCPHPGWKWQIRHPFVSRYGSYFPGRHDITPPPSPISGDRAISGEGGGGAYCGIRVRYQALKMTKVGSDTRPSWKNRPKGDREREGERGRRKRKREREKQRESERERERQRERNQRW